MFYIIRLETQKQEFRCVDRFRWLLHIGRGVSRWPSQSTVSRGAEARDQVIVTDLHIEDISLGCA